MKFSLKYTFYIAYISEYNYFISQLHEAELLSRWFSVSVTEETLHL
jgi:hypothetical protein